MAKYRVIRWGYWFKVQRKGFIGWDDIARYFVPDDNPAGNTESAQEAIDFMNDAIIAEKMVEEASQ